jgi:hypothetical protein
VVAVVAVVAVAVALAIAAMVAMRAMVEQHHFQGLMLLAVEGQMAG